VLHIQRIETRAISYISIVPHFDESKKLDCRLYYDGDGFTVVVHTTTYREGHDETFMDSSSIFLYIAPQANIANYFI
jgi:hypothetical protein